VEPLDEDGDKWWRSGQLVSGSAAGIACFVRELAGADISHIILIVAPQTAVGVEALAPVVEELRS
jgi:hypothetical protein